MTTRSALRALAIPAALAATLLAGGACNLDDVLKVQPADLIPAVDLERPVNAPLLVAGAASDFDCAMNSVVVVGAMIGEEFEDALQTAARWPYDQRNITPDQSVYSQGGCTGTTYGLYAPLQSARVSANNVGRLLSAWTDAEMPIGFNRALGIARMSTYEAWMQLLLAETFCETVFSSTNGEVVNYGGRITRAQALDSAVATFTRAIGEASALTGAAADSIEAFALLGRAKAYHDQGNLTAARTDAAAVLAMVPATWAWTVTASNSNTRRQNRVFQENGVSVTPNASVGVRYRALNDPRVSVTNLNRNSNGTNVPLWRQNKYAAVTTPIPIATAMEMQLLIAEADRTTNATNTVNIINTFRTAGNQGAYAGATDAASLLTEIIDQRRRALFLTGTHYPDIIRYDLLIAPAQGTATPWSQQFGPDRGNQLCLPLPNVEKDNNPSLF